MNQFKKFQNESCENCPINANCVSGVLFNQDGFWRSNLSSVLYECFPLKESCIGSNSDSTQICA